MKIFTPEMTDKIKQFSFLITLLAAFVITVVAFSYFQDTAWFQRGVVWSQEHIVIFFFALTSLKVIGIVWPPLPGIVILVGSIPFIGWFPAFLADSLGNIIGSSIAFFLSRKYGLRVIRIVFGQSGVDQVKKLQINPQHELEVLMLMKVLAGSIGEFISYTAGIFPVKYRNFIIATITSSAVIGLPVYYLFNFAFKSGNLAFGLVPITLCGILLYLLRKRYFVWGIENR